MKSEFTVNDTFAIKGIAILMMYIHHNFLSPSRWGNCYVDFWPLTQKMTVSIAVFFKICVSLFVFLTAYGLTVKYKETIKRYSKNITGFQISFICNRLYKLELNFWFIFALSLLYSFIMGLGHYTKTYGVGSLSYFKCLIDGLGLAYLFKLPSFNGTWWYMSLAILIVITFPILYSAYEHFGSMVIIVAWLLPIALNLPVKGDDFYRYLPCMFIGLYAADQNVIVRWKDKWAGLTGCKKVMFVLGCSLFVMLLSYGSIYSRKVLGNSAVPIFNAVVSLVLVMYAYCFFKVGVLWKGLQFLGKHSMNMFMTHTFLRYYWYHDFIYGFKYAWLDTVVLLGITLLLSVVIEALKDGIGYNRFVNRKLFS